MHAIDEAPDHIDVDLDDLIAAAVAYRAAFLSARNGMVLANMGLVARVARHTFRERGVVDLDDLVQDGVKGLIRACEKYDASRGTALGTYATPWIRQFINLGIQQDTSLIRIPPHVWTKARKFERVRSRATPRDGDAPGPDEVFAAIGEAGSSRVRIEAALAIMHAEFARDEGEDADGATLLALLPAPDEGGEETAAAHERADRLRRTLATLVGRDRHVLSLRFGLGDADPMTLSEVGAELGVTKERARQLLARATVRLRRAFDAPVGPPTPESGLTPAERISAARKARAEKARVRAREYRRKKKDERDAGGAPTAVTATAAVITTTPLQESRS